MDDVQKKAYAQITQLQEVARQTIVRFNEHVDRVDRSNYFIFFMNELTLQFMNKEKEHGR